MNRPGTRIGLHFVIGLLFSGIAFPQQPSGDNAQPAPMTGLVPDHATLSVENIEREADWYQRVLGFKVFSKSISNGQDPNWHLVIPGYRIDLIAIAGSGRPPVKPQKGHEGFDAIFMQRGWVHVSFHVENVAAALKTLQALHVEVMVKNDDKGNPIQLRFDDPEGNEIEIRRNLLV
jgi:catechol 2,3-dioxygenase-like lactoylglutathione lyase family enzyme